jgi:hypothetical protein
MEDEISFRPFTEQDALTAASWRYAEPYSAYDIDPWDGKALAALLNAEHGYHAILMNDEMVGYFCVGKDARVPGWRYDDTAIDLGMGLRPDITGKGQGRIYMNAVLAFIAQQWPQ